MIVVRRIVFAAAWLAVAVLVALGGAGVVAALNHLPGTGSRPELTWAADQAAAQALDAATSRLQALSDAMDALGSSSRQALASLMAGDVAGLSAALDNGTGQLGAVTAASNQLQSSLAQVPYTGADGELLVSGLTRDRYAQLAATTSLTSGLEADWTLLSARAMAASSIPTLLARHDQQTAAAAKEGEAGHWKNAIALLDAPDATLAQTRQLRDDLASTSDVTTLTAWLDRHGAYDAALRSLYTALLDSKGKVTNAVRSAYAAEEAAKAGLPTDNRVLVVIMGDIARGGLNQAVIDIEVARGSLAAALDAQQQVSPAAAPQPGASALPAETPQPDESGQPIPSGPNTTPPP